MAELLRVKSLLKTSGKSSLKTIPYQKKVRDALEMMIENEYSQLPVINDSGRVIGMISTTSISKLLFHTEGINPLDVQVDNCLDKIETVSPEKDLFDLLDLMADKYAVLIEKDGKPKGIITNYDTTLFFKKYTEPFLIIRDIEDGLREIISFYLKRDSFIEAIRKSLGHIIKNNPSMKLPSSVDEMEFSHYKLLITNKENWIIFKPVFEDKKLFGKRMEKANEIRNKICHFKGLLTKIEIDRLKSVREWINTKRSCST